MTKYIDRYYLNGEMYGIKFAWWWWQPSVNTLIYLPLNWDANNLWTYWVSWNWTLPSSSYYSWGYIQGNSWTKCYISKGESDQTAALHGNYSSTNFGTADRTISVWIKWIDFWTKAEPVSLHYIWTSSGWTNWWWFGIWSQNQTDGSWQIWILRYFDDPYTTWLTFDTNRHNYIITYNDTNKAKMYVDGTQLTMTQYATSSFNINDENYVTIKTRPDKNLALLAACICHKLYFIFRKK